MLSFDVLDLLLRSIAHVVVLESLRSKSKLLGSRAGAHGLYFLDLKAHRLSIIR